jgi:aldehyde:ferredoxin oxidoreductase
MSGLWGKVLRVNLSNGTIAEEVTPEEWARKYVGGRGLATRYLIEEVKQGIDPLGPENELIFMTGPLTGTPSPSAGRYTVVSKSPLTGTWGEANSGGYWGMTLKGTGLDGIILQGVSPEPAYLVIDEGRAELRNARHIWGKNVSDTTNLIKEEDGEEFGVACIGIAGESLVKYACIINDEHRAAGRCGMGAVMGSKLLKAVAVKGSEEAPIADKAAFITVAQRNYELLADSFTRIGLETFGTAMILDIVNVRGFFPTKNFQTGYCPHADNINAPTLNEKVLIDRKACFACPIKCGRVSEVKTGPFAGLKGEGPEYETISTFGGMCYIDDIEVITGIHNLCDDYGLDSISLGNTIGFAMECYEKGILTKSETQGLDLRFGNSEATIEMVHKIANREGIGDLLAEGTKRVAQRLGKGSERFAMHVKGLEIPGYDPRGSKMLGLSYATASRGACHMMSLTQLITSLDMPLLIVEDTRIEDPYKENPREVHIVKDLEDALALFDSSGACKFMGASMSYEEWMQLIVSVTGREFTFDDYKKTGERIYNLERVFHLREGITAADDTLPRRCLEEPLPEGPAKGQVSKLDVLLPAYYQSRGWDNNGKPTLAKLKELELEDVAKYLP